MDAANNAYIGGTTNSSGLATSGAAQTIPGGANDGFVAKLNSAGSAFIYVTYLGGSRNEDLTGLAVDGSGNVYVGGYTDSTNFPIVSAVQPTLPGNGISLFNTTNSGSVWSAFDSNIPGAVFDISLNPGSGSEVVLTESGIYRTVNGGSSWSQQFPGGYSSYGSYLSRSPVTPSTVYAVSCCSSFYRSTDDGVTWSYGGNPPSQAAGILADPLTANTVYLYGYGSPYVFKSTDGPPGVRPGRDCRRNRLTRWSLPRMARSMPVLTDMASMRARIRVARGLRLIPDFRQMPMHITGIL